MGSRSSLLYVIGKHIGEDLKTISELRRAVPNAPSKLGIAELSAIVNKLLSGDGTLEFPAKAKQLRRDRKCQLTKAEIIKLRSERYTYKQIAAMPEAGGVSLQRIREIEHER